MMKHLTPLFWTTFLFTIIVFNTICLAQLWDNYDGVDDLTYTAEDITCWVITDTVFEARTGEVSTPEHSYASFDMSTKIPSWNLSNSNCNEWIGWMNLNREYPSGWGALNYNCGQVLAANSDDFNNSSVQGYACGFRNTDDLLVLFKFSDGIQSGSVEIPASSDTIVVTTYTYSLDDKGVNIYIKLESDGKWTVKWKAGLPMSNSDAINPANYSDGSATSSVTDETYRGTSFKYSGWVYAHNSGASEKAYFDNFGFSQNGALPVELSSFTAYQQNENIILKWCTATEINNYGFDVLRHIITRTAIDGINKNLSTPISQGAYWETLAFVRGYGNCNSPKEYCFIDEQSLLAGAYHYKLKQIDFSGNFEYSNEISIIKKAGDNFVLTQNYPNPFNPSTTISFNLPVDANVEITIYNILGEKLLTLVKGFYLSGRHNVIFRAEDIASGVYYYSFQTDSFYEVRKMLHLK